MSASHRLPLAWLAATSVAVLLLATAVVLSGTVAAIDSAAVRGVHAYLVEGTATEWVLGLTSLAGTKVVLVVTAATCAALALARRARAALVLALSVAATQVTVDLVKSLISRPRPAGEHAVLDASGSSFPSGHSATAVALYLTVAVIAARRVRGPARWALVAGGALVVLLVGASRVYLGAHYPTDVLAGWLTGTAVVIACWAAVVRLQSVRPWARLARLGRRAPSGPERSSPRAVR